MRNVFIINGYGVPKDIFKDENYRSYLGQVFNCIWDIVVGNADLRSLHTTIIFCGGRTDCLPPYQRTEAGEMKKFFLSLMKRSVVRETARSWKLLVEGKSLCLLENLLNTKGILKKFKIKKNQTFLFHEWTRAARVKYVAGLVLKEYKPQCVPVDFYITANRYLSKDSIHKREDKMLKLDLWVLKDQPGRMKQFHRLYHKKIYFLRKAGGVNHVKALKEWWEKELALL